ncbi:class I SAM-dependent methyltransferase [Parashewanella spongiae]|uniref:Class I SAM-dependent methyltransferase n=1 Tax=Parashewanella spongiae TaxID=342950 RepID=A0A3A6U9J7_9GAMM|nr:class I SAM-dependent methyltransferase [Parashewanella spongiae]MCL1077301.1 class I SAM-dependent methyltransferase [Parashewanella spongiae]RJY18612.1 class I SAM-dependent methyltransferase [Parashewanella spongiae]
MSNTSEQSSVEAGQAVYTQSILRIYDIWVLWISNSYIWKCPTKLIGKHFEKYATANHLDVGVGTGYYLDNYLTHTAPRIVLLDLNPNSLMTASGRISRFKPEIYQGNVLEPIQLDCEPFDSISINYLLHCLPGKLSIKSVIFKHLSQYLTEDGVLFGSTILGRGCSVGFFAKKLMNFYNNKSVFSNQDDDLITLKEELERYFEFVDINIHSCVAIFVAKGKKF